MIELKEMLLSKPLIHLKQKTTGNSASGNDEIGDLEPNLPLRTT